MSWLEKLVPSRIRTTSLNKGGVPEGVWAKCDSCGSVLYRAELERNQSVCPKCGEHRRISARVRLLSFFDQDSSHEIDSDLEPADPLQFRDSKKYKDRISQASKKTEEKDALVCMRGSVKGVQVVAIAFEFSFMGGSMGSVVGEKFVRAAEVAMKNSIPLICFSASGGARMQEGILSLFQMAKTSSTLAQFSRQSLPYISVLTDPTMGGVSASFAMLGDIIIAEPNALIGFAGPRVIEQTVRETLPEGFQRAEFLLEHGAIDMIVDRKDMRDTIVSLLLKLLKQTASTYSENQKQDLGEQLPKDGTNDESVNKKTEKSISDMKSQHISSDSNEQASGPNLIESRDKPPSA